MGRFADKLKLSGRRTELLAGAGMVAVLVAVVFIFSALGSPGDMGGPKDASSPAMEAQKLVIQADEALASGDATLAVTLADKALSLDATNESAVRVKQQAEVVRRTASANDPASNDTPGDPTSPGDPAKPGDDPKPEDPAAPGEPDGPPFDDAAFEAEVADLSVLLPASFSGFLFGDVAVVGTDAQVTGTAQAPSSAARQITWAVHALGSRTAAQSFIDKTSKVLYDKNSESVRIDGTPSYFGTDGTRYATAVYVRGIYVFEVLISGDVDPSKHRQTAINAARVFPETIE